MTYSQCFTVTYMCSYLSKQDDECSQAMKQIFNKTLEKGASCYEQMKSVTHAYSSKRVLVARGCIPHYSRTMARKASPAVVNVNNNLSEKTLKMILTKDELSKLPEDNADIYTRNMEIW